MGKKLTGFKVYRHESNPKEKELHDKFIAEHLKNENCTGLVDLIIFPPSSNNGSMPSEYLSDREKQIVITTIQWLGTPVGRSFLRGCGFELTEEK